MKKFEGDFFPMSVVQILAALEGKTVEEEIQSLLEQEAELCQK